MIDAISLKDFETARWLASPLPNLSTALAADLFSNYKDTEQRSARAQTDPTAYNRLRVWRTFPYLKAEVLSKDTAVKWFDKDFFF